MDILDNIIYATYNRNLTGNRAVNGDFEDRPNIVNLPVETPIGSDIFNYPVNNKFEFLSSVDASVIERGIQRHWFDINNSDIYFDGPNEYSTFVLSSNYHLMYSYLIENTRIFQIFERIIDLFTSNEDLGVANNPHIHTWINNTERLFYKSDNPKSTNLRSIIRPIIDNSRRNAYHRMFGMDLAFGNLDNSEMKYVKSSQNNSQFVFLFERYLSEIWRAFTNANNSSGVNTTDLNVIMELATEIREILSARRGNTINNSYAHLNLSKEEFSSVLLSSWFTFIISYDSPVVEYLGCQSSTIGERLLKIGNKVGVPAHTKSQSLFEMSNASTMVLLGIETSIFNNISFLRDMLKQNGPAPTTFMDAHLSIINNWEKATGHKIKNPEANITGSVTLQPSNGVRTSQNGIPKPVMN